MPVRRRVSHVRCHDSAAVPGGGPARRHDGGPGRGERFRVLGRHLRPVGRRRHAAERRGRSGRLRRPGRAPGPRAPAVVAGARGDRHVPLVALAALFVLARARIRPDRERWQPAQWTAHFGVAVVLDGLIVTGSLFILTWTAALGQLVRATAPDKPTWAVAISYPLSDLVIVVVAVLLVVFDRVDRPYRRNLLLAAVGIVALAASDSVFAYLVSIGAESMKPWSDGGFVLGPLFIAFALLVTPGQRRHDDVSPAGGVDWWQLALPYVPVTAVAQLLTGPQVAGAGPDGVEVFGGVLVACLVLARQLLSLLDNRLLLRRVYDGQQQLTHQAYHDPLTGLANRALFADRLDRAVETVDRPLVLIFVDLGDVKEVTARYGPA